LGDLAVIATDVTYQAESCHYYPVSPSQGGVDNKKGHQLRLPWNWNLLFGFIVVKRAGTFLKSVLRVLMTGTEILLVSCITGAYGRGKR